MLITSKSFLFGFLFFPLVLNKLLSAILAMTLLIFKQSKHQMTLDIILMIKCFNTINFFAFIVTQFSITFHQFR